MHEMRQVGCHRVWRILVLSELQTYMGSEMTAKLPDLIASLRELEKKATPGPWDDKPASLEWLAKREENAELCRATRNALPTLLDALEEYIHQASVKSIIIEETHKQKCARESQLAEAREVLKKALAKWASKTSNWELEARALLEKWGKG